MKKEGGSENEAQEEDKADEEEEKKEDEEETEKEEDEDSFDCASIYPPTMRCTLWRPYRQEGKDQVTYGSIRSKFGINFSKIQEKGTGGCG